MWRDKGIWLALVIGSVAGVLAVVLLVEILT
jgi:hypothetical protein